MHSLKVGDILSSHWGYDQTNVDYYEVTQCVGASMVQLTKLAAKVTETGFMCGKSVPQPGVPSSCPEVLRKKVGKNGKSVKISSCAYASKLEPNADGSYPESYVSWYA